MKIPNQIKIGGLTYKIEIMKECEGWGKAITGKQIIQLESDQTKEHMEVTLLHEILHAINIEIPETTIHNIANGLYQVIKDNRLKFYD